MGFSGGGSNVTKPHTHDSNIVQDGGSLAANVTQFGLTAGSILYSDGANIQELAVGSASDTLTVNGAATAPEWAAAGSGAWSNEGNDILTTKGSVLEVSVSDADVYQIIYNVADGGDETAPALVMRLNDVTTSTYDTLKQWGSDGATTEAQKVTKTKWLVSNGGTEDGYNGTAYVYKSDSNFGASRQGGATLISQTQQISSSAPLYVIQQVGCNTTITGAITKITLKVMKENTEDDSQILGSMRVNSLSYS